MGAQGIKIKTAGSPGRRRDRRATEGYHEGAGAAAHASAPNIDYATSTAKTTYGTIGVKVWIFTRGDDRRAVGPHVLDGSLTGEPCWPPKRVKFRKRFKGRTKGMATRGNTVAFGHLWAHGARAGLDLQTVRSRRSRVALTREMKRGGKSVDPAVPRQADHQEGRPRRAWEKGKGNPEGWGRGGEARGGVMFRARGDRREIWRARPLALAAAKLADQVEVREGGRSASMPRKKPEALREMKTDELEQQLVVADRGALFRPGLPPAPPRRSGTRLQLRAIRPRDRADPHHSVREEGGA